ncbi:MAG: NUDIX hydrolase [Candidatus Bathyarchaeia archaeon]
MRRKYPSRPLVGVGVLIRDGEKSLLVKRASEPSKGLWSIPGGLVELGERVKEAAMREVEEETGLDVEIDRLLDVIDNIIRDDEGKVLYHYIIVDFLGHPVGGELKIASDVADARWVRANEIKQYKITRTLTRLLKRMAILTE